MRQVGLRSNHEVRVLREVNKVKKGAGFVRTEAANKGLVALCFWPGSVEKEYQTV